MRVRPKALVVYSGQGGEAEGYRRAGFEVLCTDLYEQPRCPRPFEALSALDAIAKYGKMVQFIAGGPVCKSYSKTARIWDAGHPAQIPETRDAMRATGLPYVIENVEDAEPELIDPIMLCGLPFGLHTYRHRLFESNRNIAAPKPYAEQRNPEACGFDHPFKVTKMGRPPVVGEFYHAVGNFSGVRYIRQDMGVPWMNRDGINQCIPPAYSEHVGRQIISQL